MYRTISTGWHRCLIAFDGGVSMDKEQPAANNEQSPPEEQRAPRQRRPGQQWANLVEERIREAMERGDFDHLQGEGKPLDLDENPYAGDRALAFHLLKSQHVLPPELELGREIDEDLKRAEGLLAEFRRKRAALKQWQRTSLARDPLARWRLPSTSEAQQSTRRCARSMPGATSKRCARCAARYSR